MTESDWPVAILSFFSKPVFFFFFFYCHNRRKSEPNKKGGGAELKKKGERETFEYNLVAKIRVMHQHHQGCKLRVPCANPGWVFHNLKIQLR